MYSANTLIVSVNFWHIYAFVNRTLQTSMFSIMRLYDGQLHVYVTTCFMAKCVKQIAAPFLVFAKLDHVRSLGTVEVIALYVTIYVLVQGHEKYDSHHAQIKLLK